MFFEHVSLRKAPFGLGDIQRGAHCSDQGADADHRPEALRGYSGPLHDRSRRLRHTEMELEGKSDTFPNFTRSRKDSLTLTLQELNVGVMTEEFELPLYPKVGFWTIRVVADGQASVEFINSNIPSERPRVLSFYIL